jgi:hypothetical protein
MILGEAPVWNASAIALLRQYLDSDAGKVFLAQLASRRTALMTGSDNLNAVALRATEVAGYEKCINTILQLAEPLKPELATHSEQYPDLDDETAWKQKQ